MMRARALLCIAIVSAAAQSPLSAQIKERAEAAGQGVHDLFGTDQRLQQKGFEPLSTDAPMQTVNGTAFPAQMACQATAQFLRVTIFPTGTSDIGHFTVEFDRDLNGSLESSEDFVGPFAGVC